MPKLLNGAGLRAIGENIAKDRIVKKKLKGQLSICMCSNGKISITIVDESSRVEFFDGEITPEEFGLAVTGLGARPIEFEARGMDKVGLKKESKPLVFPIPDTEKWSEKEWAAKNAQRYAEIGWTADTYFGSQTSVRKGVAYTNQYRFVKE